MPIPSDITYSELTSRIQELIYTNAELEADITTLNNDLGFATSEYESIEQRMVELEADMNMLLVDALRLIPDRSTISENWNLYCWYMDHRREIDVL